MIGRLLDPLLADAPGGLGAWYGAYKTWRWGDPYVRLVATLADRRRLAVDVGAHEGEWTFFMRRHAALCVAFECNPHLLARLQRRFGASVALRPEAVSDQAGVTELRIPRAPDGSGLGRATIEAANPLDGAFTRVDVLRVATVRLDDVIERPVGLIKVDVEGHELAVLRGAAGILARDRPNLVLELEDRHAPGCVAAARALLAGYGYRAAYLRDSRLEALPDGGPLPAGLWNFVFTAAD
jgi:FkbM family methyltransferase